MQHIRYVDPRKEWYSGFFEWLARYRGIASTVGLKIALAVAAYLVGNYVALGAIVVFGIALTCCILKLRQLLMQRMLLDERLHCLCHQTRDDTAKLLAADSVEEYRTGIERLHQDTVERLAQFFRELLGDRDVGCIIRLAELRDGKQVYATCARSAGYYPNRSTNSEVIPAERGLPFALLQAGNEGVFLVPDVQKAAQNPALWFRTKNDDLEDVTTVLAAPINGWEGGPGGSAQRKVMLGILYVTARRNIFRQPHATPLKAVADFLGMVYPMCFQRARTARQ